MLLVLASVSSELETVFKRLTMHKVHCHEADVTAEPRFLLLSTNAHREPFDGLMLTCLHHEQQ